jgi:hypothetical protein
VISIETDKMLKMAWILGASDDSTAGRIWEKVGQFVIGWQFISSKRRLWFFLAIDWQDVLFALPCLPSWFITAGSLFLFHVPCHLNPLSLSWILVVLANFLVMRLRFRPAIQLPNGFGFWPLVLTVVVPFRSQNKAPALDRYHAPQWPGHSPM